MLMMKHTLRFMLATWMVIAVAACEPPVDEPDQPSPPEPPETSTLAPGGDASESSPPASNAEPTDPELHEVLARINGMTVMARIMRSSELGHANYDDSLSGEPMGEAGRRWLELFEQVEAYADLGVLHPKLHADSPAGTPRLIDYADAAYIYHMHHSGGRFQAHGLFDDLTHRPSAFLTQTGQRLVAEHFHDGRFHGELSSAADMAFGLDAFHALAYAWVRWHKPGGEEDMGQLDHAIMEAWMGHDYPDLLDIARQAAAELDDAWDDEAGIYDLGEGRRWQLRELASLIRGHKGLYELLYVFGSEDDRDLARQLFDRQARVVAAVLDDELIRDWGLPAMVEFDNGVAVAASDRVDVEAQWRLVHHLTGGFALLREQDGTSQFLERRAPELADRVGQAIDQLLQGALDHHMTEGITATTLDYDTGETRESALSIPAVAGFVMAAGNGYRAGNAFDRPGRWTETGNQSLAERSRALYDAILAHGRLLGDRADET